MEQRVLLRLGGICALMFVVLTALGYGLEVGGGMTPAWFFWAERTVWLLTIPFWVGLYLALRKAKRSYVLLGALAGILSSAVGVGGVGTGFWLTALRAPRVGFISLALPGDRRFTRGLSWLGIATAALTLIELEFWILRGSPNDPFPVGFLAATLGYSWIVLTSIWLLRSGI